LGGSWTTETDVAHARRSSPSPVLLFASTCADASHPCQLHASISEARGDPSVGSLCLSERACPSGLLLPFPTNFARGWGGAADPAGSHPGGRDARAPPGTSSPQPPRSRHLCEKPPICKREELFHTYMVIQQPLPIPARLRAHVCGSDDWWCRTPR